MAGASSVFPNRLAPPLGMGYTTRRKQTAAPGEWPAGKGVFMRVLEQLEPQGVFRFFEELCAIPHGSRNCQAVSDWCAAFARERGLECHQDQAGNVIIIQEATPGYEAAAPVILQGHLDMVCEKEPGCTKDMAEPDSYSEDGMNRILLQLRAEAEQSAEPAVKPNVVLVVSESFFDPTRLPGVSFSADPVPNFHTLAEAFPSGVFLSNTYAGGTGNVEMELFTGIPSAFLGAGESLTGLGDTSAYRRVPSLARVFGAAGYETLFVHSYNDELYDRARNIPALGFDQIIYQDDFLVDKTYAGGYVSDDTLADELIARFEAKGDGPVFLYGLTMENHQPYFGGKFNTPAPVAASADNLSGEEAGVLDALVHGLTDADAALGKLTDYFAQAEEPTILVFLGDHLPGLSLGGDDTLYTRLGYASSADTGSWDAEELKRMHSTDFLVWNNFGAELEAPAEVSCTGLGTYLLGWAGLPKPLYFQWVSAAMEEMTLYRERLFVAADGTPSHTPPENCEPLVAAWRNIVYDMLYGEQYITGQLTEQTGLS